MVTAHLYHLPVVEERLEELLLGIVLDRGVDVVFELGQAAQIDFKPRRRKLVDFHPLVDLRLGDLSEGGRRR